MKPLHGEEIKEVLEFVSHNISEGDQLYIYTGAQPAFNYYRDHYELNQFPLNFGRFGRYDLNAYVEDLAELKDRDRVWFVFSHVPDWIGINEEQFFLFQLDNMGERLKEKHAHGAAVYLYNLME